MEHSKPTLIVANWKMHLNTSQSSTLMHRLSQHIALHHGIEIVIAPSNLVLQPLSLEIDHRKFKLAAQNAYSKDEGPYTGEVSFSMLHDLVHYVIVGHSARRLYFNETLEVVQDKVAAAVRNRIPPIICIGETKPEKTEGMTKQVIHDQVVSALANLTSEEISSVVIAYEPIWAISTNEGEVAKPADMQKALDYIRYEIHELYGATVAKEVRVIYGGSVNEHDARAYLELSGCDGVLVGAASLNYLQFSAIVESAYRFRHEDS